MSQQCRCRPSVEWLEDRATPSTTGPVVTNIQFYAAALTEPGGVVQRSDIQHALIDFDDPNVSVDAGAVAVQGVAVPTPGGVITTTPGVSVTTSEVSGHTRAVLSFLAGSGVEFGSVVDGRYDLHLIGAGIHDSNGNGQDGDTAFFRYFGDANGDARVDDGDLAAFQAANRSRRGFANYRSYFDYDQNGFIDAGDYYQFLRRYHTVLNADGTISLLL